MENLIGLVLGKMRLCSVPTMRVDTYSCLMLIGLALNVSHSLRATEPRVQAGCVLHKYVSVDEHNKCCIASLVPIPFLIHCFSPVDIPPGFLFTILERILPTMSTFTSGANADMFLLLAWLSTLDLQEQARQDRLARPWKYETLHRQERQPQFPEELVQTQIAQALKCFASDPIYGPLFEELARYRLTYIEFTCLPSAIELQELADPSWAFFFSDKPYYEERRQKTEVTDETDAFWRVACSHIPLADRLNRLSKTWQSDVCHGASELRTFFTWYLDLIQRPLQLPFFLVEYMRRSLFKIDWHKIAAKVLDVPACQDCHCGPNVDAGAVAEYLGELFKVTGDEILPLGQRLPEPERTQVLLLSDLCRETTKAMRLFLREGEQHAS
jgi:hypothetical protein